MLQATAGLVLLIACANLANLLLARAAIRRREFAVRTALGASRRRLLRQFMTEGALLSIAGSALGVWLAHVGLRTLTQAYPAALPRSTEVSVDLPVLLFACGVAIATTMFFGLAQLRHIGVKDLARHAHRRRQQRRQRRDTPSRPPRPGDGRSRSGRHPRDRRGPAHTHGLQPRERRRGIQSVAPGDVLDQLAGKTYAAAMIRVQTFQRLLDALRAVPGVEAATAMSGLPPNRPPLKNNTRVADATVPSVGPFHVVDYYQYVMPDYFETMGIPIVRGRSFQPTRCHVLGFCRHREREVRRDVLERARPDRAARQAGRNDQPPWFTVVGVAKDVKQGGVDQETGTELYMAVPQIARPAPGAGDRATQPRGVAHDPRSSGIVADH